MMDYDQSYLNDDLHRLNSFDEASYISDTNYH